MKPHPFEGHLVQTLVPGITRASMDAILEAHKQELGITDVNKVLSAALYMKSKVVGHNGGYRAKAFDIEGLLAALPISSPRIKQLLSTILAEVMIEDPTKADTSSQPA
ncbi:MAG: hypothetical protein JWM81_1174 [Candidatus Saccharibacteria bacterium]|nr:hypothetical protein [Candidatus Saccharibacteria bacterium]